MIHLREGRYGGLDDGAGWWAGARAGSGGANKRTTSPFFPLPHFVAERETLRASRALPAGRGWRDAARTRSRGRLRYGNGSRLLPKRSYEHAWQRACPEHSGLCQRPVQETEPRCVNMRIQPPAGLRLPTALAPTNPTIMSKPSGFVNGDLQILEQSDGRAATTNPERIRGGWTRINTNQRGRGAHNAPDQTRAALRSSSQSAAASRLGSDPRAVTLSRAWSLPRSNSARQG